MTKRHLLCFFILFGLIMSSCSFVNTESEMFNESLYSDAVFNKKLSSLYRLDGRRAVKIDENTVSHYDLETLPDAKILTDNWLIAEDGKAYRLDIDTYFREDYCSQLYQIYWNEVSADMILELYATDTVLKSEPMSGRILCAVHDNDIASYIFLETCTYSDYLDLIRNGGELYTCEYYPQIGELHLVKADYFESNETVVNEIGKKEDIIFIRHQIWPDIGYWSMTGLYVFTANGNVFFVYNGEILNKEEDVIDISFRYGNYASVMKNGEVSSNRNTESSLWTNVRKIVVSELPEDNLGLTYKGDLLYTDSNIYADYLNDWKDIKDITIMCFSGSSYPLALTNGGRILYTPDNPFADILSELPLIEEFCVSEGMTDFAVYSLTFDGILYVCK